MFTDHLASGYWSRSNSSRRILDGFFDYYKCRSFLRDIYDVLEAIYVLQASSELRNLFKRGRWIACGGKGTSSAHLKLCSVDQGEKGARAEELTSALTSWLLSASIWIEIYRPNRGKGWHGSKTVILGTFVASLPLRYLATEVATSAPAQWAKNPLSGTDWVASRTLTNKLRILHFEADEDLPNVLPKRLGQIKGISKRDRVLRPVDVDEENVGRPFLEEGRSEGKISGKPSTIVPQPPEILTV
ncbi:hypothetical protein HUJ04_005758 [Dendroctonus ponderosae]|nr:hypothetical protein HUJ04_005758 [Dendroctonus ponderosae]